MKRKWTEILLWCGLATLILVVVITSMILHAKKQKLEDLKDKNDIVKPETQPEEEKNKIFLKNFEILVDKELFF